MLNLFELAVSFLVMMTFVNGMFFVFGGPVAGHAFAYETTVALQTGDLNKAIAVTTENIVKEGDVFGAITSFVSTLVGTAQNAVAGVATLTNLLLSFGNAWSKVLEAIFSGTGLLWDFMQWTIVPFINFMQLGAIVYLILTVVSAVRGGGI